ncbi:kinase-like protein [Sporormia fimetaria CBS 119925]|uniref:non-specific serine/threonine protein kinase n=1 Tax=Sporormia fimetaria CBS 119925 TaxID=1340428 RepID=A0A6A6VII1_9PLEO|nr:kinase-like protein [Sporormia fimetaria CBS 119925]
MSSFRPRKRETTAPPDDNTNNNETQKETPDWHFAEGLQLTFSHGPKAGQGFVLGTEASSCDIIVPKTKDRKISRKHCYLTFDAQRRPIVRDCSTNGTIVSYDGKGGERRHNFTWIIGDHEVTDSIEEIVLEIDNDPKFQIIVSKPRFPRLFFQNVDKFRSKIAENEELPLGALGLQSGISTMAASGAQTPQLHEGIDTPNDNSILLKRKKLGQGAFSVVHHVWDVSTGIEYASKMFINPEWEHITRLIATIEKPSPRLILEIISDDEVVLILRQGLLALTYLHGQTPPIVHRDIKPQNILVQSRDPLHIKLADFGLSKASDDLPTLCGTYTYLAPEIARYCQSTSAQAVKYKNAVDIWSLGVVIFEYACGLPDPGPGIGLPWCEKIISALDDWDSDGLVDLLSTIIVMDPNLRASAPECLRRTLQLRVPGRCLTPTPPTRGLRQEQTEDDDGSTAIILDKLWGTQGTSYPDKSKVSLVGIKRRRSPPVGFTNTSLRRGRSKRQNHHSLSEQPSKSRIINADAPLDDTIGAEKSDSGSGHEFATGLFYQERSFQSQSPKSIYC